MCRLFRRGSETTCQKTGCCRAQALAFAENCVDDGRYQTKVYIRISAISLSKKASTQASTTVATPLCSQSNRGTRSSGHEEGRYCSLQARQLLPPARGRIDGRATRSRTFRSTQSTSSPRPWRRDRGRAARLGGSRNRLPVHSLGPTSPTAPRGAAMTAMNDLPAFGCWLSAPTSYSSRWPWILASRRWCLMSSTGRSRSPISTDLSPLPGHSTSRCWSRSPGRSRYRAHSREISQVAGDFALRHPNLGVGALQKEGNALA